MNSYEVRIWEIGKRADPRRKDPGIACGGRLRALRSTFEELFKTKALADSFRSGTDQGDQRRQALRHRDRAAGGRGASQELCQPGTHTQRAYVEKKWPRQAAKSRRWHGRDADRGDGY